MADASLVLPFPGSGAGRLRNVGKWLFRRILLVFSVAVLTILLLTAVLAPWIAPHNALAGDLDNKNTPPFWTESITAQKTVVEGLPESDSTEISLQKASNLASSNKILDLTGNPLPRDEIAVGVQIQEVFRPAGSTEFLLGTDPLGRDLLSRIIWGARVSLVVAGVTLVVGGVVGTSVGLVSGYYGGWVDEVLMRLVDIVLALPLVLVALVLVVAVGEISIPLLPQKEVHLIATILSLFIWVRFARQVRGEVLYLKTLEYVALAKVAGCSTFRILRVHLFPGVLNTVIVVATLQVSVVILLESILSFLGAGVPPPTPAWGSMVAEGRSFLSIAWWVSTMPGLALALTVLAFNLLGDWIRDAMDPRLRQQE